MHRPVLRALDVARSKTSVHHRFKELARQDYIRHATRIAAMIDRLYFDENLRDPISSDYLRAFPTYAIDAYSPCVSPAQQTIRKLIQLTKSVAQKRD